MYKSIATICFLLFLGIQFQSCKENTVALDNCSFTLGDVQFTKSLNQAATLSKQVNQDKIEIQSTPKTDFFIEPDGSATYANAPILLLPLNMKTSFTVTTKVSPEFSTTYDAGALYLFAYKSKWMKFAFELDERKLSRIVTVRTNEISDDNNHDAIQQPYAFLKISSNGKQIGYYYSTDSTNWQLVRVHKNDFPSTTYLGLSAQSPIGNGIKATFEHLTFQQQSVKDFRKGL